MELCNVHLDFHTSQYIKNIGEKFNADDFGQTLKNANVDEITLCAKCHHGYCYYPSKIGTVHPNLKFDLLGEQIKACRKYGIKVIVYITGAWSVLDYKNNPSWRAKDLSGKEIVLQKGVVIDKESLIGAARPECLWELLCLNGDYGEHIKQLSKEVCELYNPDGLFYDIFCLDYPCTCEYCQSGMEARGLDTNSAKDIKQYMFEARKALMDNLKAILLQHNPQGTIFFNSGCTEVEVPIYHDAPTHFEIENLPSATNEYDLFINKSKFFKRMNKDVICMTGKFHYNWGEFGGYKKQEALLCEVVYSMMNGDKLSIGDQLHPDGKLDTYTYALIGESFSYAKKIEPYCFHDMATNLAVIPSCDQSTNLGFLKILLEKQVDYDVIYEKDNLFAYDCIIALPNSIIKKDFARQLIDFSKKGKLVIIGDAAKNFDFFEDAHFSEFDVDYIVPDQMRLLSKYRDTAFLAYNAGYYIKTPNNAKVLASIDIPFFNRTMEKFCGHLNTPNRGECISSPAAAVKGNILFIAHDLGKMYLEYGMTLHKDYFIECLKEVYTPLVECLPSYSSIRVKLLKQDEKKYFLHIFNFQATQRGKVLVVEDILPIFELKVKVKLKDKIKNIKDCLDAEEIKFEQFEGYVQVNINKLEMHKVIEINL